MEPSIISRIEREVEDLDQAEVLELASRLIAIARSKARAPHSDWSTYDGILDPRLDPLEYQRAVRQEWE